MPNLFWPNFDFENELIAGKRWQPSEKLKQLNARFAPVMKVFCGDDDRIVMPNLSESTELEFPLIEEQTILSTSEFQGSVWELIAWGPTERLESLAAQKGWRWNQPPIEVVKTLNDRLTAFKWERSTGRLPTTAQIINDEIDLKSALEKFPDAEWVIKARFGMSGRERIRGKGTSLSEPQQGWLRKKLAEQESVILEPWLEIESEAGLQFEIPQQGEPQFLAALPLVNAPSGEYQGSRLKTSQEERERWQPAIEQGLEFAKFAQGAGYFGPLGIDVCFYRDGENLLLRSGMDINARWTMGRIAWEYGERHNQMELSTWWIKEMFLD